MIRTKEELVEQGLKMFTTVDVPSKHKEKLMEAFVEMTFCAGQTDGLNKVKQLLKEDEKNVWLFRKKQKKT